MITKIEKKIEKLKRKVEKFIKCRQYEKALMLISSIATILFEYGQKHVDEELEDYLLEIGNKIGKLNDELIANRNDKNIVFYDALGFDFGGFAYIYLDALCKLDFHVTYIINSNRVEAIPHITELLNNSKADIIPVPWNINIISRSEYLITTIESKHPVCTFLHTIPSDVSGILAFNRLKGVTIRYQINLMDHAFWLGKNAFDYCLDFRNYGASISLNHRNIRKEKIMIQPYYPIINMMNEDNFKGYPFMKEKNDFVLFSGGFFLKSNISDDSYYTIVRNILEKYLSVKFWHAGYGDNKQLRKLEKDFSGRVFYTQERSDLIEILRNCDLYLSIYPYIDRLMIQYAAMSGIIPLIMDKGIKSRGVLKREYEKKILFYSENEFILEFDHLYKDLNYRSNLESKIKNAVISKEDFKSNLDKIIKEQSSNYIPIIEKINANYISQEFRKCFHNKFRTSISTRFLFSLIRIMPLYYTYCMENSFFAGAYIYREEFDISIIIATYNSDWRKLEKVIYSVLLQKGVRYEILVTDDGSEDNHFDKLEKIFRNWGFKNYKLLGSEFNKGTCRNIYKAVKTARGKYVRLISPGDYCCKNTILKEWFEWCENRGSLVSFGKAIYYCDQKKAVCIHIKNSPRNLWIYKLRTPIKIRMASYLYLWDLICGADFMVNRELICEYLLELTGIVKYAEDSIYRLMAMDGIEFDYFPQNVCFYEYGSGISTSQDKKWECLLKKDFYSTNNILAKRYVKDSFCKKYIQFLQRELKNRSNKIERYTIYPLNVILKLVMIFIPAYGGMWTETEKKFYSTLESVQQEITLSSENSQ